MIGATTPGTTPLCLKIRSVLLSLFSVFFSITLSHAQPAGLVVNEVSQGTSGSREWVELVVVGPPCSTVDLRGWILDDNNGVFVDCAGPNSGALPGTGIAPGHVRFKFDPIWQAVPVGTILLIYSFDPANPGAQAEIGGLQVDYTDSNCDRLRVIPLNASNIYMEMDGSIPTGASSGCCPNGVNGNPSYTPATYMALNNQGFAGLSLNNNGDAFQVRDPGANFFHGLSYGATSTTGCTPQPQFDGGPFGLQINVAGGNTSYQFRNTVSDDYNNVANFQSFTASTTQSPGQPNNCANAQWIGSLRRPPESAFQTSGGPCLPDPGAAPQSICVGQSITLTLPNTNACTSDAYIWSFSGSGGISFQGSTSNSTVTLTATSAGTVEVTITATVDNSQLYSQGGCTGPQFPESLEYDFPLTITPGPTANPTTLSACNQGGGQATFNLTIANNAVNGNSGLPVSWYLNSAGTTPVPNPSAYTSGPGTVYAVVTSGPCSSNPVPVTLVVLPVPTAFPASMPGCDQGNGQGAFNLTALNSTVNGNSGFAVNYWLDPATTIPITNPSNYTGPPGAIYATVNNGNCNSAPVPITLTVVPAPTSTNTFINVSPIIACGTTTATVTFFFPSANLYNVSLLYGGLTFNGQNLASGASANFSISQTTDFILTSATLAQNNLCSVNFSTPPVLTVEILDPPNLSITGDTVICTGQSISLDTVVTDLHNPPGIIPITFHTGLPPSAANEVGPVVSPGATTTYYAFADGGAGCQQTFPFTIAVSSGGTPVLGSTMVCSDDPLLDLNMLLDPDYPNGTWSGPGVTNNEFDPAGLTGVQTLTFIPDECGDPATTTVEVLESGTPVLGLDTLCQTDPPIDLVPFQDPNFPDGEWDGTGVSGTTFDPAGQSGETPLVFTPVGFCASPATAGFFVLAPDIPALAADTLCQDEDPFDLHALLDPAFPDGSWSGTGVSDTLFDPSLFSADTLVTLTFTPTAYCTAVGTTTIFVQALAMPSLGTDTLCDTDPPIDLTGLEDPAYPGGVWSGPGVADTLFDPAGLGGNIELTYVVTAFCVDTALTNIAVIPSGTPVLGVAAICEIDDPYDLSQLQDTLYPAGNWSGTGVSGSTFDPAGLSGLVDLTFTPAGNCANPATTTIEVFPGGQPLLLSAILCENDSLLDLTTLQDPLYPDGTWSGPGVSGSSFNPSGLSDTIALTFTPADTCILEATTEVIVLTTPTYSDFTETCDPNNLTYTISFVVGGGVPGTYTINGVLLTDTLFVSGPINTGEPYSFELDDANGCGPLLITGAVFCDCITDAGSMDTGAGPIAICEGESIDALPFFLDGELLDPNDVLQYALHDNSGNVLGNGLAINDTGFFDYPAGATPFQSYYISVIAGNDDGTGNVDLNDPCLSVAPGLEVIFRELDLSYSGDATLCETECYDWTLSFTGQTPFTLSFEVTANGLPISELLTIFQNDTTITFCPSDWGLSSGTAEIQLQTLLDGVCQENLDTLPPVILTILPVSQTTLNPTLCPGESILVNGVTYDENNPMGTEMIPNGNFNGCDSTVTVALSFFPPAGSTISETLCDGESITVYGTVYDQGNPAGTEVVAGGSANGCDSTILVDLSFFPPAQFELLQTLCSGESISINGAIYDENNPSGMELITGGSYTGCDSTIQVGLSFLPLSSFDLAQTLCDGDFVLVNGVIYDQDNPTGTELIANGNYLGCDSTVNVNLGFFPPAQGALSTTLCDGESIVVNGTVYDGNNPSGTELFPGGAFTGCDSTLQVNLTVAPNGENNITTTLCPGESITVNGTVYDEANPLGTEVLPNGNYAGCDSIINVVLSFFPPAIGVLDTTLCAEDFLFVNGVLYDAGNPAGTEIFPGGSFNGCDSTLNIDLSFLDPIVFELTDTLSGGASIVINGTTYDESNPSGTEVIFNGSYLGCDSTILINLFFQNFQLQYTTLPPTCFGYQDGQLIVDGISGSTPPYEISIDGQFFLPIDTFPFAIADLSAGAYSVIVEDANGAQFNLTVVIPSKPEPLLNAGSDLVLDLGQSADVAVEANFPIAQITWEPGDYLDCDTCVQVTIQQPESNISYTITAFDTEGCLISDILNVQVQKPRNVYVPNIFSPNNDGLNDLFMVFSGREVRQILAFQVYDRWGNQLYEGSNFQPNDADYGWDGTYQGQKMDAGVYVFYIQVEFEDGEVEILKGGVTLVR